MTDDATRKKRPLVTGMLDYFPDACLAVAECSHVANEQHNPGEPMHWNRDKSTDHANSLGRHLIERGTFDTDGVRHSAKVAWRALALLQIEIEEARQQARGLCGASVSTAPENACTGSAGRLKGGLAGSPTPDNRERHNLPALFGIISKLGWFKLT